MNNLIKIYSVSGCLTWPQRTWIIDQQRLFSLVCALCGLAAVYSKEQWRIHWIIETPYAVIYWNIQHTRLLWAEVAQTSEWVMFSNFCELTSRIWSPASSPVLSARLPTLTAFTKKLPLLWLLSVKPRSVFTGTHMQTINDTRRSFPRTTRRDWFWMHTHHVGMTCTHNMYINIWLCQKIYTIYRAMLVHQLPLDCFIGGSADTETYRSEMFYKNKPTKIKILVRFTVGKESCLHLKQTQWHMVKLLWFV